MAERQQTRTRDPIHDTFAETGLNMGMSPAPLPQGGMMLPATQGDVAINILGGVVTSQRVAVPRVMEKIRMELSALAQFAGDQWFYYWEVNDKRRNRKVPVSGPTIKLANDLARTWGNCRVDVIVQDEGTHWMFYGRFVDLETGYNMMRAYQQRKRQGIGMEDEQRALDMVFQIGQSKCIRNVVCNALQTLATFCVEEAKNSVKDKIAKNPEKARERLLGRLEALGIELRRVEKVYGRKVANWTVPEMAKIHFEISSVEDAMANAENVWPLTEDDEPLTTGEQTETTVPKETAASSGETRTTAEAPQVGRSPVGAADQETAAAQAEGGAKSADKATEPSHEDGRHTTTLSAQTPASAAAPNEWIIKKGGARLGTWIGPQPKQGDTIEFSGIKVAVKEVWQSDRELVIEQPTATQHPPAEQQKKAEAKTARKGGNRLFGEE